MFRKFRWPSDRHAVVGTVVAILIIVGLVVSTYWGGEESEREGLGQSSTKPLAPEIPADHRQPWRRLDQPKPAAVATDGTRDLDQEVVQVSSVPRVRGVVLDLHGQGMFGAVVAVFRDDEGQPNERAVAICRTDVRGRFTFKKSAIPKKAMFIMAAARAMRPACLAIESGDRACQGPIQLHLTAGQTLRGRITVNGSLATDCQVLVDAAYGVPGIFIAGSPLFSSSEVNELLWRHGRPETKHARAKVDENGFYEIGGLGPGKHSLVLRNLNGTAGVQEITAALAEELSFDRKLRMSMLPLMARQTVDVPNLAANFDLSSAYLLFRLEAPRALPISTGRLTLLDVGDLQDLAAANFQTNDLVLCQVPVDRRFQVEVVTKGYESQHFATEALEEGECRNVNLILQPKSHLEISVLPVGSGAETCQKIDLAFEPIGGEPDDKGLPIARRFDVQRFHVTRNSDQFVLMDPPLEPGLYRVHAELSGTVLLPIVQTLDIPPHGRIELTLEGQIGARVDVDFVWPHLPGSYSVQWRLMNSQGTIAHQASLNLQVGIDSGFGSGGPNFYHEPVVPPGSYHLQVDVNGQRQQNIPLMLKRGDVVKKKVHLTSPSAVRGK